MNARQAIERLGYTTVVRDLGEQRAAGKIMRERLLRATTHSGRFVEGLVSVDARQAAAADEVEEERIWKAMLTEVSPSPIASAVLTERGAS